MPGRMISLASLVASLLVPASAVCFNIDDLARLASSAKDIPSVLAGLPEEYLQNFVLQYKSKSTQASTFKKPRVILYGSGKSGLTFAYSGLPGLGQQNLSIEAIQFNEKEGKFDFYSGNPLIKDGKVGGFRFEKNPQLCVGCHRGNGTRARSRPGSAAFPSTSATSGPSRERSITPAISSRIFRRSTVGASHASLKCWPRPARRDTNA